MFYVNEPIRRIQFGFDTPCSLEKKKYRTLPPIFSFLDVCNPLNLRATFGGSEDRASNRTQERITWREKLRHRGKGKMTRGKWKKSTLLLVLMYEREKERNTQWAFLFVLATTRPATQPASTSTSSLREIVNAVECARTIVPCNRYPPGIKAQTLSTLPPKIRSLEIGRFPFCALRSTLLSDFPR